MSTIGGQTVTIDRTHFETILRRANFSPDDVASTDVSISKSEFDGLKSIAAKYSNLCQNLLRGGVDEETIDELIAEQLLSQDDATIEQHRPPRASAPSPRCAADPGAATFKASVSPADTRPKVAHDASNDRGHYNAQAKPFANTRVHPQDTPNWADAEDQEGEDSASGGELVDESAKNNQYAQAQSQSQSQSEALVRPYYERQCARSLLLCNLAEGTTHLDITESTRGGQLLDIYLRPYERTATVSFVQATDARTFFDHVRRHDLYIRQKRVDVRWSDRQFILPGHVASKIATGATRNLVIRRCNPRHTAAVIREDLDHIHNLVVIKIEFIGGSCHVKTNSIHNAMFARTCMMSRLKYKHSKIDWDVDECCQPFEQPAAARPRKDNSTMKRSGANTMANRFHLLNLDDDDDDEDEMAPAFSPTKTVGIAA